jgi:hypothetical protein
MSKFVAKVTDGKFPRQVSERIRQVMQENEGQVVRVVIEPFKRRSLNQNAFYWGEFLPPIVEMFREAGNNADAETVHEYLKTHIGGMQVILKEPNGTMRAVTQSSASLSTAAFESYLEQVRAWASAFDLILPFPNEHLEG